MSWSSDIRALNSPSIEASFRLRVDVHVQLQRELGLYTLVRRRGETSFECTHRGIDQCSKEVGHSIPLLARGGQQPVAPGHAGQKVMYSSNSVHTRGSIEESLGYSVPGYISWRSARGASWLPLAAEDEG